MFSFFADRDNVRVFSDGFDLLGDQSGSEIIANICSDVQGLIEEDDDFFPGFFSLEALLTSLHNDQAVIDLNVKYPPLMEVPAFRFRHATHCLAVGNTETADEIFRSFLSKKSGSSCDDAFDFLAAGRLNDPDEVFRRWMSLVKESGYEDKQIDDAFIQNPDRYSLLAGHTFRERIEGVRLLIRENISAGREKEAYSLIWSLLIYNSGFLDGYLTPYMIDEGGEEVLPGLYIAVLMSGTAGKIAGEFLETGIFTDDILHHDAMKIFNELHDITRKYLIRQLLIQGMVSGVSNSNLLASVRDVVNNRDDLILGPLEWVTMTEFEEQADSLIETILKDNPNLKRAESYSPNIPLEYNRFRPDTRNDREEDEDDWEEDHELEALLSDNRYSEAFDLISGYLRNHVLFEDVEIIFDLAMKSGRLDDLVSLRPFMDEGDNHDGMYLIQAYQRLMNKDVKGCLSLIDRAVSVGYPKENAMILTAAYMNKAGYPKRAVGICEKLLKKQDLQPGDIVPILAAAYRLQGREKEATELEQTHMASSRQ